MIDFEDMKNYLIKIQEDSFQTKVLNVILSCFEEIDSLKKELNETRDKVNEIIKNWNKNEELEDAETINDDIEEDAIVKDIIEEENGTLINEPPREENN